MDAHLLLLHKCTSDSVLFDAATRFAQNFQIPARDRKRRRITEGAYFTRECEGLEYCFNTLIDVTKHLTSEELNYMFRIETVDGMMTFLTEQMSAKKGLKYFGDKGAEAIKVELEQFLYRKVMEGRKAEDLT